MKKLNDKKISVLAATALTVSLVMPTVQMIPAEETEVLDQYMITMGYGKKNTIKIDPLSYNIGLIGESGIGKTTIIKEMCEKLVGEDGYRFLECGKEDGADGINGINYLNCPEWSMDYDEETNSIGFEDFVDDVVENKLIHMISL